MALNAMLAAFALWSRDAPAKKLALGSHLLGQVFTTAVNYAKPPGTGLEGSPGSGPLPLMAALMLISLYPAALRKIIADTIDSRVYD